MSAHIHTHKVSVDDIHMTLDSGKNSFVSADLDSTTLSNIFSLGTPRQISPREQARRRDILTYLEQCEAEKIRENLVQQKKKDLLSKTFIDDNSDGILPSGSEIIGPPDNVAPFLRKTDEIAFGAIEAQYGVKILNSSTLESPSEETVLATSEKSSQLVLKSPKMNNGPAISPTKPVQRAQDNPKELKSKGSPPKVSKNRPAVPLNENNANASEIKEIFHLPQIETSRLEIGRYCVLLMCC